MKANNFSIEYKGRKYRNVDSAFKNVIRDIKNDAIPDYVEEVLKPFQPEIRKHGGKVRIKRSVRGPELEFENVPEDLVKRILKAIK